jgi:hypothetical protein
LARRGRGQMSTVKTAGVRALGTGAFVLAAAAVLILGEESRALEAISE